MDGTGDLLGAIDGLASFVESLPPKPTARNRHISDAQVAEFRALDGQLAALATTAGLALLPCGKPMDREAHESSSLFLPGKKWLIPKQREAERIGYSQLHVHFSGIAAVGEYLGRLHSLRAVASALPATEPPVDPPKPAGEPLVDLGDVLEPLEKALALLVKHPDWSDTQIAKAAGVSRTTLYKETWLKYQQAREALQSGRNAMPRGEKRGESGSMEAWDSDE